MSVLAWLFLNDGYRIWVHIWLTIYGLTVYDCRYHHWSYMNPIYDYECWITWVSVYESIYGQSYMVGPYMIIYGNHIWSRYMILIYEHPSESYTEFPWDVIAGPFVAGPGQIDGVTQHPCLPRFPAFQEYLAVFPCGANPPLDQAVECHLVGIKLTLQL